MGDVDAAYNNRSVAIMRSALAGDSERLSEMISPNSTFTLFQGDVGVGPRSTGPLAAIEFAKQIAPRHFQFSASSAGPLEMNPCGLATAELTFTSEHSDDAVIAEFKYEDGFLTGVRASRVALVRGDFHNASPR